MGSPIKLFAFVIFVGAAIFPIYAFASSNSEPGTFGESTGTISGWTVSNIDYQLSDNPSFVKSVNFDLDAPARTVSVKLDTKSNVYANCTNVSTYHWQCDFPAGVRLSSMDEFRMVAVGN